MRVSCSCLVKGASESLIPAIKELGVEPIVTNQVIRAVYDGKDKKIGEGIIKLFVEEREHDIYVHYDPEEIAQQQKKRKPHPRSSKRKKQPKKP